MGRLLDTELASKDLKHWQKIKKKHKNLLTDIIGGEKINSYIQWLQKVGKSRSATTMTVKLKLLKKKVVHT